MEAVVAQSEEKFYKMDFSNIENSNKPIIFESRCYRFEEGRMVAVNALDIPKDSPFRDLV